MDRRRLLSSAGALAVGALAGCLSRPSAADEVDASPTDTRTSTPSPTDTPTPASSLAGHSFTVEDVSSGTGENSATVSFGDAVVVEGTIRGANGCYTASLASATYRDGRLTVVVRSHERDGAGACTQALVDIEYRARFTFEGALPERVVVRHAVDGETTTVTEATR